MKGNFFFKCLSSVETYIEQKFFFKVTVHKSIRRPTVMLPLETLDSLKLPFWECRLKLGEETLAMLKKRLTLTE